MAVDIRLRVLSDALAGQEVTNQSAPVPMGWGQGLELRFHPARGLDPPARQATVALLQDRWILQNLRSRNGTFVASRRIRRPETLQHGQPSLVPRARRSMSSWPASAWAPNPRVPSVHRTLHPPRLPLPPSTALPRAQPFSGGPGR